MITNTISIEIVKKMFFLFLPIEIWEAVIGPIKQLLLASKSVPYYPKLSLSTLFYSTFLIEIDLRLFFSKVQLNIILNNECPLILENSTGMWLGHEKNIKFNFQYENKPFMGKMWVFQIGGPKSAWAEVW